MDKDRPADGGSRLEKRESEVLRYVMREHILTGRPVGSRTVASGARLDLSPASIRSVMSRLESRGLLEQPHRSAGRIPTDEAYKIYVSSLMGRPTMSRARMHEIDTALLRSRGEVDEMLAEASRQLSRLSRRVGVVMAPDLQRLIVEKMEFVSLADRRIVAILVGRSGMVHSRILSIDQPLDQDELDRIGRDLSDQFGGMTLPRMREQLLERIREVRKEYDRLVATGLDLGHRVVKDDQDNAGLFIEGTSNLLDLPEFADLDRTRALLRALEEKSRLVSLLGRVLRTEGVQVMIGSESLDADLHGCSLVASNYHAGDTVMGTVGIVGPTRIEYAKAIGLVDHLARVLTSYLTDPGMEKVPR
jgi:heat-inducible transcriptional repressor